MHVHGLLRDEHRPSVFPGLQSDLDELLGCGKVLKKHGGVFTSHLRSYSHTLDQALEEVFQVGLRSEVPVQVSHLYWQPYTKGLTAITKAAIQAGSFLYNRLKFPIPIEKGLEPKLQLIERKREEGLQVNFDMVPTSQGFTELFAFMPPYASEGSKSQALERLKDRTFRKRVLSDINNVEPLWPHRDGATWSFNYLKMTGWNGLRVMAVASEHNRWMEGETFPEIGKKEGNMLSTLSAICLSRKRDRLWSFIRQPGRMIPSVFVPCGRALPIPFPCPLLTPYYAPWAVLRKSSMTVFRALSNFL